MGIVFCLNLNSFLRITFDAQQQNEKNGIDKNEEIFFRSL